MNIRFYNARILSMEENAQIIEGELWTQEDKILYIGEGKETNIKFDREIDAEKNLLMPGFKNAHTHSAMTFLRSFADDLPLHEWLEKQVFPMEAKLESEMIYHLSKLAILEYLSSGITANFDMYYHPSEVARASMDMGFRTTICIIENDEEKQAQYFEKFKDLSPLIKGVLGIHAEYSSDEAGLMKISRLANKFKTPVFTHISETKHEVEDCIKRTGMSPPAYLDAYGIFNFGGGGFHCVHVDENDIEIFKKRGMYVVTNPGSNVKLASGIAPLTKFMEAKIPIAIGTDGPASNNALDFFREMYLTTTMQKIKNNDASAVPAENVLEMATVTGAKAMGISDSDVLAEGKNADLIMIDLMRPNMQPINNITKNIVYSGSKENIKMTMVAGKILYEDREFFVGESAKEIYIKANEIISRLR